MLQLEDVTYSRTAAIAGVTDYYDLLTKMYLNDSQVVHPPEDGWPSIINADPETLQTLGKSEEVLSLLAHLPYLTRFGHEDGGAHAIPAYLFVDWQELIESLTKGSRVSYEIRIVTEGATFTEFAPPHVFGLTIGGHEETPIIILDTKLGLILWEDCPNEIQYGQYREQIEYDSDGEPEEEATWRHDAATWTVADFFEVLKDQFIRLRWIPTQSQGCGKGFVVYRPKRRGNVAHAAGYLSSAWLARLDSIP